MKICRENRKFLNLEKLVYILPKVLIMFNYYWRYYGHESARFERSGVSFVGLPKSYKH